MGAAKKVGLGIGISVAAIVIVIGLLFAITEIEQRKALEKVDISFHDARVKDIGFSGATLDIQLRMYNPNDITATLDKADYDLWFNDNYLGNGQTHQRLDIPPMTSRIASTEFDLSFEGAGRSLLSAITEGHSQWRISGIAYYDSAIGTMSIPFDLER